jgi:hypothetical protein
MIISSVIRLNTRKSFITLKTILPTGKKIDYSKKKKNDTFNLNTSSLHLWDKEGG